MTTPQHDSFTLQRHYPQPVADVWAAWTNRDLKAAWFGDGLQTLDAHPGGAERLVVRMGDDEHTNETRYFVVEQGAHLVMAYSMAKNGRVHTVSLATVQFAPVDGGTQLTYHEQMTILPPSDGAPGRQRGWNALLDALAEALQAKLHPLDARVKTP